MDPEQRHAAAFEADEPRTERAEGAMALAGNTAVDLAVDLASERPHAVHGLHPDRSMRWLGAVMAGGAVVLLTIVAAVRSGDEPTERDDVTTEVERLHPQLRTAFRTALLANEGIRMESITAEIIRNSDSRPARVPRRVAQRIDKATTAPTPMAHGRPRLGSLPAPETAPTLVPATVAAPTDVVLPAGGLPSVDEPEPSAEPEPEPSAEVDAVDPPPPIAPAPS